MPAGFDDAAQFEALPVMLRGEIVNKFAGNLMRASHLFAHLEEKARCLLLSFYDSWKGRLPTLH